MTDVETFVESLISNNVTWAAGVPDSLLSGLISRIDSDPRVTHVRAANEGGAVGMAIGHFLGTGKLPLVYMQNSGIGNAVNPLLSMCHSDVYSTPVMLVIGWRGLDPSQDEPQHRVQGRVTRALLDAMEIPLVELRSSLEIEEAVSKTAKMAQRESKPAAILVAPDVFTSSPDRVAPHPGLIRRSVIKQLLKASDQHPVIFVSTTGKISRELHELALEYEAVPVFLTIGAMGHSSMIALALAEAIPDKQIICLDGDGALQMHMGALSVIGSRKPSNFMHVLLNNGVHESVGGQLVANPDFEAASIANSSGYGLALRTHNYEEVLNCFERGFQSDGPTFIEVMIEAGTDYPLSRPEGSPVTWRNLFVSKFRPN